VDALATKNGVPVQDLKADDLEVSEDGAPQKIETFEHIVIEPTPPGGRIDQSSVDQAIQLAADPHRRVFVIYLDTGHVDFSGVHDVREPLIDFINRVMSDDDLVGVMTPEMGPQEITFGRKTGSARATTSSNSPQRWEPSRGAGWWRFESPNRPTLGPRRH
jgi:hypothetical protein